MRDFKKIDLYINKLEKACLILGENLNLDFFDSLIRAGNDLLTKTNNQGLDDKALVKLNRCYHDLRTESFLNEEVRLAMELLIIKSFKHRFRYPLSLMTPDSICYLFAYIVGKLSSPKQAIIDMGLGTANLLTAIANYLPHHIDLIGIENNPGLVELAKLNVDLQGGEIKIHFNDCLDPFYEQADFVVGDLDTKRDEYYFPYKVVLRSLELLKDKGFFIFLIDNDFFNQENNQDFKNKFTGTMLGIVILPDSLFKNNLVGKSILVGCNKILTAYEMMVLSLPGINDKENLNDTIEQLDQWLSVVKGIVI